MLCVSDCNIAFIFVSRAPGVMFSRWSRYGWGSFQEVDLFTDRYDTNLETLSQAIRAAAAEDPEADGSVLLGQMQGTVVGLRYYTGVVSISYSQHRITR